MSIGYRGDHRKKTLCRLRTRVCHDVMKEMEEDTGEMLVWVVRLPETFYVFFHLSRDGDSSSRTTTTSVVMRFF